MWGRDRRDLAGLAGGAARMLAACPSAATTAVGRVKRSWTWKPSGRRVTSPAYSPFDVATHRSSSARRSTGNGRDAPGTASAVPGRSRSRMETVMFSALAPPAVLGGDRRWQRLLPCARPRIGAKDRRTSQEHVELCSATRARAQPTPGVLAGPWQGPTGVCGSGGGRPRRGRRRLHLRATHRRLTGPLRRPWCRARRPRLPTRAPRAVRRATRPARRAARRPRACAAARPSRRARAARARRHEG